MDEELTNQKRGEMNDDEKKEKIREGREYRRGGGKG